MKQQIKQTHEPKPSVVLLSASSWSPEGSGPSGQQRETMTGDDQAEPWPDYVRKGHKIHCTGYLACRLTTRPGAWVQGSCGAVAEEWREIVATVGTTERRPSARHSAGDVYNTVWKLKSLTKKTISLYDSNREQVDRMSRVKVLSAISAGVFFRWIFSQCSGRGGPSGKVSKEGLPPPSHRSSARSRQRGAIFSP